MFISVTPYKSDKTSPHQVLFIDNFPSTGNLCSANPPASCFPPALRGLLINAEFLVFFFPFSILPCDRLFLIAAIPCFGASRDGGATKAFVSTSNGNVFNATDDPVNNSNSRTAASSPKVTDGWKKQRK